MSHRVHRGSAGHKDSVPVSLAVMKPKDSNLHFPMQPKRRLITCFYCRRWQMQQKLGEKHPFIYSHTVTTGSDVSYKTPRSPAGHFQSSLVLCYSWIHTLDVHFKGALFSLPPCNSFDLLTLLFLSNEMQLPLRFPKVVVSDQSLPSHARSVAESKWHFNSPHPFTFQHLLAWPVLKCVPGKPDHAVDFNEFSTGSMTSAGVPWTDAFQRTISFWEIYGRFMGRLFFFFFLLLPPRGQ